MKKHIILTESDLHRIVKESVKRILNEESQVDFDKVYDFVAGFAKVELDGKYNFINEKGEILYNDEWFTDAENFKKRTGYIYDNGVEIELPSYGYALVEVDNYRWYYLRSDGVLCDYESKEPVE